MSKRRSKLRLVGTAFLVAALVTEMQKDPSERTGHGKVAGLVPYDFRPPTLEKLRLSVWDEGSDRIITPTAFGAGWGINFAEVVKLWKRARAEA